MVRSRSDGSRPPFKRRRRLIRRTVVAGLCVAIIGSAVLASIEVSLAAWITSQKQHGGAMTNELVVAALGKAALTHALLWCTVMVLFSAGIAGFILRRTATPPEPLLWAIFILLAGAVVVPADLGLASLNKGWMVPAGYAGVSVLAAVTFAAATAARTLLRARWFRRFVGALAALCLALIVASGVVLVRSPLYDASTFRVSDSGVRAASRPGRPNVLWIVLDAVRADRLTCYGYDAPTTPFLDEWSERAIVYEGAVTNAIWTVPSHASMFTGLSLRQHCTDAQTPWLAKPITTVAEVLQANGYATASISNNPWVSPTTNLVQGFADQVVVSWLRHLSRFSLEYICELRGITPPFSWLDGDYGSAVTNQLVARWLDRRVAEQRPFFLFINYMEAHLPYRVPGRYRRMFMTDAEARRSYDLRHSAYGDVVWAFNGRFNYHGGDFTSQADRHILERQYLAAIRYLDDRVRETIGMFEARGLLDNTLVIITADHGEHLDTHGMWSHYFHTYNDLTHVPLLIREPGRREALRAAAPVQPSDLYATILSATLGSFEQPFGEDLHDLLGLANRPPPQRVVVVEQGEPDVPTSRELSQSPNPQLAYRAEPRRAAVDGRFKYIRSISGRRELYDIVADPGELCDLTDAAPREAERLDACLNRWLNTVPQRQPVKVVTTEIPEEVLAELKALGYLGGD